MQKILVLGLGNDIMSDDAVGLCVVRQLRQRLGNDARFELRESTEMGLALLDYVSGFDEVVLVDAVQTGTSKPGTVQELEVSDLRPAHLISPHLIGVSEMLALGRAVGLPMPRRVKIYGIEVEDPLSVGTALTPNLQRAFPEIVERVLAGVLGLAAGQGSGTQAASARAAAEIGEADCHG